MFFAFRHCYAGFQSFHQLLHFLQFSSSIFSSFSSLSLIFTPISLAATPARYATLISWLSLHLFLADFRLRFHFLRFFAIASVTLRFNIDFLHGLPYFVISFFFDTFSFFCHYAVISLTLLFRLALLATIFHFSGFRRRIVFRFLHSVFFIFITESRHTLLHFPLFQYFFDAASGRFISPGFSSRRSIFSDTSAISLSVIFSFRLITFSLFSRFRHFFDVFSIFFADRSFFTVFSASF